MQADYLMLNLKVTTLSPLHIGTGRELLHEYDYAVHNKQTWRLNEDAILEAQDISDPSFAAVLAKTPPANLLRPQDYQISSRYFRYVIQGVPRSTAEGAQLREQIKNINDQPYLPGSSLKGALRTVLAWHAWKARNLQPDRRLLDERRPKFAARGLEQKLLGSDPNHDLLRALLVSDSQPVGADRLMLINAKVLTARSEGSPIEVEAVRPETVFLHAVKLDLRLFSQWAAQAEAGNFRLGGARQWLESLPALARAHALNRIQTQLQWFQNRPNSQRLATFYSDLQKLSLKANQFVIQLGWGGGWDSKTFGSRLAENPAFFEWVITNYRLARGRRQRGDLFPKSRRVAMRVIADNQGRRIETPAAPLGWVLVEMLE